MITFAEIDPRQPAERFLGFIPKFLSQSDPRPAAEQFNDAYAHGGGWDKFEGFTLGEGFSLIYPGDPEIKPVAFGVLHPNTEDQETIFVYPHAWVMIMHIKGHFEVARMD